MIMNTDNYPQNKDINVDNEFTSDSSVTIDEGDRLRFAKQVLLWIGCTCVGVFALYSLFPTNEALYSIFELIKIGALPLITLVISFYFPNTKS